MGKLKSILMSGFTAEKNSLYKNITPQQAKEMMDETSDYILLDVRTPEEFLAGHIPNAVLLPDYEIIRKAENIIDDKNKKILVYCQSGGRSLGAAKALTKMGYTNVFNFGGIMRWPYSITK
ncbi:Sulfurtransferase [bioreactor metagenome]|uniref:Sulfurtransferase n=1 Tax=bioreactor metagenome TaxID=1076179 RepID=A0A645DW60_9ZZZZ